LRLGQRTAVRRRRAERFCAAPARSWFDLVVVLQTDNGVLYDRLQKRGYKEKKITENIDCEIFGVVLEEAQASYPKEGAVRPLRSDSVEDCEKNTAELVAWLAARGAAAPA
jgi:adenylate kinase